MIVVYPDNGILFSNKKGWILDKHNGMDKSQNYAEYKKTDQKKEYILYCPIHTKF